MEKNSNPQSQRPRQITILGTIFKTIFNLILLTLLSWVVLTAWFCIKQFLLIDYSLNEIVQKILSSDLGVIARDYQAIFNEIILIFQNIQNFFIVKMQLNENSTVIIVGSIEIILVRTCLFILLLPFFIMIYFMFVIDGLVQRDIRKFQAARESTFFFHRIKSLSGYSLFTFFFIYLVIPLPISPEIILVPMVFLSSYFTMLAIKNYKKYL